MRLFYRAANAAMRLLLVSLTRWEVRGKQNVPRKGPLIVVANHLSIVDPPLLGASVPRVVSFMAKEELFEKLFARTVMKGYCAFRVRRGRLDREAYREALARLNDGLAIGVFPEGKRSSNQKLQTPQTGASLLALRSGAPILPVAVTGTENIKGLGFVLRRPHVMVNIGPVFSLTPAAGKLTRSKLVEDSDLIMLSIARLLPETYCGQYGVKEGFRASDGD